MENLCHGSTMAFCLWPSLLFPPSTTMLCGELFLLTHTVPCSPILPPASLCYGPALGDLGCCSYQHILSGLLLVRQAPFWLPPFQEWQQSWAWGTRARRFKIKFPGRLHKSNLDSKNQGKRTPSKFLGENWWPAPTERWGRVPGLAIQSVGPRVTALESLRVFRS